MSDAISVRDNSIQCVSDQNMQTPERRIRMLRRVSRQCRTRGNAESALVFSSNYSAIYWQQRSDRMLADQYEFNSLIYSGLAKRVDR